MNDWFSPWRWWPLRSERDTYETEQPWVIYKCRSAGGWIVMHLHPFAVIRAWRAARLNYKRRGAYLVLRDAVRKGKSWERVEQEQHAIAEGAFL